MNGIISFVSVIFASGIVFYIVYCFNTAWNLAYKLCHPKKIAREIIEEKGVSNTFFEFVTRDGVRLKGLEVKPDCPIKGTIIACHYLGGTKEMILPNVKSLVNNGYRIFSFDYRNHGESQSVKDIKFNLKTDIEDFIENIIGDIHEPTGIIGFSMGATPALMALSQYNEIKAAVLDSGPLLLVDNYFRYTLDERKIKNFLIRFFYLVIYKYYAGFMRMAKMSEEAAKNLERKHIFIIHGLKDSIIPFDNIEYLLSVLKGSDVKIWRVRQSRHLTNFFIEKDNYEKNLLAFFESCLFKGDEHA